MKLPSLLLGYRPEEVYSADETGLFSRALPETLTFRSEKCYGGKLSKERLTILFCAYMAGQQEDMLVIGKAAQPRAYKNSSMTDYQTKFNTKAWMTKVNMREWASIRFKSEETKEKNCVQ